MTYIQERQSVPKALSSWFSIAVHRNIGQYGREPSSDNSVAYVPRFFLLWIQVERLMTSVIAFVITVDWLRCEANC